MTPEQIDAYLEKVTEKLLAKWTAEDAVVARKLEPHDIAAAISSFHAPAAALLPCTLCAHQAAVPGRAPGRPGAGLSLEGLMRLGLVLLVGFAIVSFIIAFSVIILAPEPDPVATVALVAIGVIGAGACIVTAWRDRP